MTTVQAFVLGLVQGLTEWLPISSTAHLKIVPELLGWPEPGVAFSAVIQWGTLLAALFYFRSDIVRIFVGWLVGLYRRKPTTTQESRLGWMILIGTVPIVVLGYLLKDRIENDFRRTDVIAWALILGAIALAAAEGWIGRRKEPTPLSELTWKQGLLIGLAQTFALIPGASRSGVTITGGLFVGVSREAAARYSFLLSFPAIFGAGLFQLVKARKELLAAQDSATNLIVATLVATVVGYVTIGFLLALVKRYNTSAFIVYRILLGVLLLVLSGTGVLRG